VIIGFNIIYQQFRAMYNSGLTLFISSLELCTTVVVRSVVTGSDSSWDSMCQHTKVPSLEMIKLGFNVPAHRSTKPQINMIPHPVTLN